jgi:Abnormal spindle-like microcephaly-assoc'd, ASPM-SPD-2-Hydin/FG-GAP-like repeat
MSNFLRKAVQLIFGLMLVAATWSAHAQRSMLQIPDAGNGFSRSWVDINGDGRDDYCLINGPQREQLRCYLSLGDQLSPVPQNYTLGPMQGEKFGWVDVNGDGQTDICRLLTPVNSNFTLGGGPTSGEVRCHLGPGFTASVSASVPFFTMSVPDPQQSIESVVASTGLTEPSKLFFVDINGDGKADICYLHFDGELGNSSISSHRCFISSGVDFVANPAWRRDGVVARALDSVPASLLGHLDVNGDGFADFCFAETSISCFLGSATGISLTPSFNLSSIPAFFKEGAAFIDINGDGYTDFCRLIGSAAPYKLGCRLSTGKGWESTDRLSSNLATGYEGYTYDRYWADINGDGLPDYCRAIGVNPRNDANPTVSVYSNMACRMTRGGDGVEGMFSADEVLFTNAAGGSIDFGVSDGGRGFCDMQGRGFSTFCRATREILTTGENLCYEGGSGQICVFISGTSDGVATGFYGGKLRSDLTYPQADGIQANVPVMQKFSDSLGAETVVTYFPMSNPEVYSRSSVTTGVPLVYLVTPRAPAVFETRAWRVGVGATLSSTLTGTARYHYKDLKVHRDFGLRGFRERWHLTEGGNSLSYVKYFQALGSAVDATSIQDSYLELGVPVEARTYAVDPTVISVPIPPMGDQNERRLRLKKIMELATVPGAMVTSPVSPPTAASPFMLRSAMVNSLGQTVAAVNAAGVSISPAQNPRYRPVVGSTKSGWDWNGRAAVALPSITTSSTVSYFGNVLNQGETTTQAGATWSKAVASEYLADNPSNWLLGRMTKSTSTSTVPTATAQIAAYASSAGTAPNANVVTSNNPPSVVVTPPNYAATVVGQNTTANATIYNNTGGSLVLVVPTVASITGTDFVFVSTTCTTLLASGGNCTVAVKFTPTVTGLRTGSVSVSTASGVRTAAVSSQGSASASTATLVGTAPNLGTVWLGAAAPTAAVTIRNDGNVPMTLTGLASLSTRFQLTGNTCTSIGVGASCTLTLSMPTTATGNAANTVTTIGATNNLSFTINGAVASAVSSWSVTSLAFGTVAVGQSVTNSLTLSNTGVGTLAANWSGALLNLPAGFSANTSACSSVLPGGSCSVSITFTPTAGQSYAGSAIRPAILSSAANTLGVTGTGVVPTGTLTSTPSSYDFGIVTAGAVNTVSLSIKNTGAYAATGITYSLTGASSAGGSITVSSNSCSTTLAAGATCVIAFAYAAASTCDNGLGVTATMNINGANLTSALAIQLGGTTNIQSGCGARVIGGGGK